MKIVIFYKSFQKYGGQERVVWELSHYLAKKGYDVVVFTLKIKDEPETKNLRVKKIFLPPLPVGLRNISFAMVTYFLGKRIKKNHDNTCILGFGKTFFQDIYRSGGGVHKYYFKRATLKYKTKLSRSLYKLKKFLTINHWSNLIIEHFTFTSNNLKAIIVPSNFVKKQITENFSIRAPIVIIRNTVRLGNFFENSAERKSLRKQLGIEDNIVLSFVSTNHRLKGLDYLLISLFKIKEHTKNIKILIAGNGSERYFRKRIKELNLNDTVIWLGKRKDVRAIYNASDIFVYPTLFDTFGYVVLESLFCGCVPVVSKYCGASEIIRKIDERLIINDPTDPNEIAEKIIWLLKNDNLAKLKKISKQARTNLKKNDQFREIESVINRFCH